MSCPNCPCSRRRWLGATLAGLALLPFRPVFAFLKKKPKPITIPLDKVPKLKEINNGIIITIKKQDVLLIRTDETNIAALDPECRHKKCDVLYKKEWGEIRCDCHGSKYSVTGEVINPPSKKNLRVFPITFKDDKIELTLVAQEQK